MEKSKEYGIGMVNTLFSGSYLGTEFRGTVQLIYDETAVFDRNPVHILHILGLTASTTSLLS